MSFISKLSSQITGLFTKKKLDEELLEEINDLLLMADCGVEVAEKLTSQLKKEKFDKEITPDEVKSFLAEEIAKLLLPYEKSLEITEKPYIILLAGVNGSGKTTMIGKLAHYYKSQGKSVGIIAADTFRAAAAHQLKVWADRTHSDFYAKHEGADAASVVYEGLENLKNDIIFIDTAGRLQNRKELIAELEKIVRTIKKRVPEAPHSTLLSLDATVGGNAISQVEAFNNAISISGLVVNKLDGTAKAGILLSLCEKFQKSVLFVGIGEEINDLSKFSAKNYSEKLILSKN